MNLEQQEFWVIDEFDIRSYWPSVIMDQSKRYHTEEDAVNAAKHHGVRAFKVILTHDDLSDDGSPNLSAEEVPF